jgi:hypothetical protein
MAPGLDADLVQTSSRTGTSGVWDCVLMGIRLLVHMDRKRIAITTIRSSAAFCLRHRDGRTESLDERISRRAICLPLHKLGFIIFLGRV